MNTCLLATLGIAGGADLLHSKNNLHIESAVSALALIPPNHLPEPSDIGKILRRLPDTTSRRVLPRPANATRRVERGHGSQPR